MLSTNDAINRNGSSLQGCDFGCDVQKRQPFNLIGFIKTPYGMMAGTVSCPNINLLSALLDIKKEI